MPVDLPKLPDTWLLLARSDWDWVIDRLCAAIRSETWHVRRIKALEAWRVYDTRPVGDDEFGELRRLLLRATRRPWFAGEWDFQRYDDEDGATWMEPAIRAGSPLGFRGDGSHVVACFEHAEDAEAAVACVDAVPRLLDEIDRLRRELAAMTPADGRGEGGGG